MSANRRGVVYFLIFGLLTVGLYGCERKVSSWYPFATPVNEDHGITTPEQRIKKLHELVKKAPTTTDPGQRESICQELAQEIRKEPDSIMRSEILRALGAYGGPTANAVLRLAVRDPDAEVRVIACDLWGKPATRTLRPCRCSPACLPATATATYAWQPPAAWATRTIRLWSGRWARSWTTPTPPCVFARCPPSASQPARTLAPTPATLFAGGST